MAASEDDRRWRAVIDRDAAADGSFVYAVRSTGVYCRPSCPSRRPGRHRVTFFPTAAAAEAAGYRACLRCRPTARDRQPVARERLERICRAVRAAPDREWTSAGLARTGHCSQAQMRRAFRSLVGVSPRDYVRAVRRQTFLSDLRRGRGVTRAIFDAGFGSTSRVYNALVLPGMTPATYGKGGEGAAIDWLTVPSPAGTVLVAATARGLCFVGVGGTTRALLATLRAEFPRAAIARRRSPALGRYARAAENVIRAKPVAADLPVDVRATVFQWRVWQALARIPVGETRTYGDVARAIGAPTAVRAVARACATNPLALVVPCHRVVGADGRMHGYRWGVDVKRSLLAREQE